MNLITLDCIISLGQSAFLSYYIYFCLYNKNFKLGKYIITVFLFFSSTSSLVTGIIGDSEFFGAFFSHFLCLIFTYIFFKKKLRESLTAFSIFYCLTGFFAIIFGSLIFEYIHSILPKHYEVIEIICILYIPMIILLFLCFKCIAYFKKLYQFILIEKLTTSIIILTFLNDFIISSYAEKISSNNLIHTNLLYTMFLIFFILILIYFSRIHQKSKQIFSLNEALEIRNKDLSKIKHDYGAQISYLYGLSLMNRYDDLKNSLKSIIDNNSSVYSGVALTNNDNSILSVALQPAIEQGIHVIIEEDADLNSISINEMDLFRIISNIVNNAIIAMNGKGIICAKCYELDDTIILKLENNGPKILEENLDKIFLSGFTTKSDKSYNHGFGLDIVKELVENNNGKILVKSTDISTIFTIHFKKNK